MKLCIVAVVLAIGCGSKSDAPAGSGSAEPRPSVTDPMGFCERARAMMFGRKKCFPEDASIKMGLDGIADLLGKAPADPAARRKIAAECAVMLDGMMRTEQPKNCPLDVTDSERQELADFLAAWYGERTKPPVTGNADTDALLAKLAAQRDTACACATVACAREATTSLEADVTTVASDAPQAARDAAPKLLDEAVRCRQKLAFAPAR